MFIVSIIFLAISIAMFLIIKNTAESTKVKFISIIPFVIGLVFLFISSFHVIDQTEIGVVRRFGEITGTLESGPNFLLPIDKVSKYDLTVQSRKSDFASYTKDAQPVDASIEYQYELNPEYITEIAGHYGSQSTLDSKIANLVEEKAKIIFSRYGAMSLLENRSTLSSEIESVMSPIEEMFHINFTSVVVKNLDFSDAFEKSVEAKMEAEQNALKAEQEKKQAIIEAEKTREVSKINAEADIAKAQGEAEAMRIKKEALEQMPQSYILQLYLEKWNGILPQIITEGSSLMITPDFN